MTEITDLDKLLEFQGRKSINEVLVKETQLSDSEKQEYLNLYEKLKNADWFVDALGNGWKDIIKFVSDTKKERIKSNVENLKLVAENLLLWNEINLLKQNQKTIK